MSDFARSIVAWQRRHGRHDLPWQARRGDGHDAYRIWLAEIMLQQTQVGAVIPYYERFLARFPDVRALALAGVEEVMALWSGLGYYARAHNLHRCARQLVERHGGAFPRGAPDIAALPGIGRSTAAAIAAFAHGERAAILDGNVKRVLCRAFGVEGYPGAAPVERRLWALAESLLPQEEIAAYTQGLMDLGATVCTLAGPRCERCPVAADCVARRLARVADLPAPRPRRTPPLRSAEFLLLLHGDTLLLECRPPAGIWGGLLAPPERAGEAEPLADELHRRFGCRLEAAQALPPLRHGFTHFTLEMRPLLCRVRPAGDLAREDGCRWLRLAEAAGAALPAPVKRLIRSLSIDTIESLIVPRGS
jgi:A/G-specific adenine glycosylase